MLYQGDNRGLADGNLAMDETEEHQDRGFVARLEKYFTSNDTGYQEADGPSLLRSSCLPT